MIDIANKINYLKCINDYLVELKTLTNKKVKKEELSDLDEVEVKRDESSRLKSLPEYEFTIAFEEKEHGRFNSYINSLYEVNQSELYLWTKNTNACGLYKTESIKNVNFTFPFNVNEEGIIVLLASNLKDKLVLDFYEDSDDELCLDVEARGDNWSKIKY